MTTRLLLASDFDGTAAEISIDPGAVSIDPQFAELLTRAASTPNVSVALISGRDIGDLARRIRGTPAWLAGSHGLDIVAVDGAVVRCEAGIDSFVDAALEEELLACGFRLERKKHGIALHWRGVEEVDANHALVRKFREAAQARNLKLIDGRAVVEARVNGPDKRDALRIIAEKTGASRVVFAGDDLTDVEACRAADRGVFLASAERPAPEGVEAVSSRRDILRIFEQELSAVSAAQTEESWPLNR